VHGPLDVADDSPRPGDGRVTAVPLDAAAPVAPRSPRGDVGRWGMVLFVLNEATLFACLIGSYFYLGVSNPAWPPPGIERPELELPLIMTVLLLTSSVTLVFAERAFEQGKRGRYYRGVAGTVLLGAAFLFVQFREYRAMLAHTGPTQHAYTSLFFTITGLHGTHVAFGLLFLLWALLREIKGTVTPARPLAIKNASLYWHFVDGVWLVILTSLYLSPRWY
jgi:heme/copper-type cytochrome/quinol oxidase subunit 3